jgi:hypothetical protein
MTWTIKLGKTKFIKTTHLSPLSGTTFGQKSCEEPKTWDEWDEKKFNISFEVGKITNTLLSISIQVCKSQM